MADSTPTLSPRSRAAVRREDWLRDSVLSGFIATFAMTVVFALAYGLADAAGDASGTTLTRWLWALAHNPVTRTTADWVLLAIALNLVMGLALALVYGRLVEPALGGRGWRKGLRFALIPFVLSVVLFLPIMGGGFLGFGIGAGPLPIIGNLLLHLVYGVVLGAVYALALEAGLDDTAADRATAERAERGAAWGILVGLVAGAAVGWLVSAALMDLGTTLSIVVAGALVGGALGLLSGSYLGMGDGAPAELPAAHR